MYHFKKTFLFLFVNVFALSAFGQSNYEKLGMQAFMKSDYKTAVNQLEKAGNNDPNNASVVKMLAYSYFQCGDFENAIAAYSKLVALKPNDYSAFYYRGKARLNIANAPKESLNQMRENFYTSAIKDFTKAIEISSHPAGFHPQQARDWQPKSIAVEPASDITFIDPLAAAAYT
ncbi:MAG: tetratricopeptide repeat protein, partial [Pedobacter sp.]|nr:tetratricopeptide repeat protein [Pedobacter sp.]